MIDGELINSVAGYLKGAFPLVYVGVPQDNEPISMPAILLQLNSDFVVGSRLQRGKLTLSIMSQADDTTPAEHAAFQHAVSQAMRAISINSPDVRLDGIVPMSADEQHAERHWVSVQLYVVGFSPKN